MSEVRWSVWLPSEQKIVCVARGLRTLPQLVPLEIEGRQRVHPPVLSKLHIAVAKVSHPRHDPVKSAGVVALLDLDVNRCVAPAQGLFGLTSDISPSTRV